MPQLDFSTYPPQLVWLAISFIALYFLMARVALPRIATVLEERRDRIARDLDEAERSREESEAAVAAYEAALAEARAEAHDIARANRDKLAAEIEAERAKVDAVAAEKAAEAERAIAEAKSAAVEGLGVVAGDLTEAIVKRLVGGRITKKKIADAVAATMKS
jgi:F-type H+-transporting ATPase subunit b